MLSIVFNTSRSIKYVKYIHILNFNYFLYNLFADIFLASKHINDINDIYLNNQI